ncbi:TPA: LacI family DNA-binding transcriptional regulator [Pseudomonas putida]|uniref:LacI family DNA-binding transcriptional regulator n=1 Tax=Pseudomonas sp. TaxID=306 RepID=UPI002647D5E6|nr:LacI family DNA-binding transcriptional regulator [Pseudomonas sp.]
MAKPFTTLDDVAKAAGMSRAQVSRALRGGPGVRPETRERIDQIASELEYRPNLAARSLVSARSSIVGLVIGDPNNAFHIQLAQSVDKRLLAAGFEPVKPVGWPSHDGQGGFAPRPLLFRQVFPGS